MALFDGRKFAAEKYLDIAGHVLHAYYHAPQATGRLEKKAVVISGESMIPMLELFDRLEEKLGDAVKNAFLPFYVDYQCFKIQMEQGFEPVICLFGADCSRSETNWNCGACGFPTCAEFNKYSRNNSGMGKVGMGPCCAWMNFDYSMACDYACAAAHNLCIENRMLATFGSLGLFLGYLEDISLGLALPIGPQVEYWWYNRPRFKDWINLDNFQQLLRRNYTNHFQTFSSELRPNVKSHGPWWERDEEFVTIAPDQEYVDYQFKLRGVMMETVLEIRPKVEALKEKMLEDTQKALGK